MTIVGMFVEEWKFKLLSINKSRFAIISTEAAASWTSCRWAPKKENKKLIYHLNMDPTNFLGLSERRSRWSRKTATQPGGRGGDGSRQRVSGQRHPRDVHQEALGCKASPSVHQPYENCEFHATLIRRRWRKFFVCGARVVFHTIHRKIKPTLRRLLISFSLLHLLLIKLRWLAFHDNFTFGRFSCWARHRHDSRV